MSNFDIFNWQPSAEEIAQFAETLRETQGGRQLLELVDTGTITPAAAPAPATPAPAATITGTLTRAEQKEIFIEQRREELQAQGKPVDEAKLEARFRELAKTPDGREQIATVVQRAAPEIMQAVAPTKVEIPAATEATTYDPTRQMVVPVSQARVGTNAIPAKPTGTGTGTGTATGTGTGTGTATGAGGTKTVVTTDQFVRNGRRILRTTYTDGSVTDEDLGAESKPDTSREDAAAAQRRESAFTLIQSFLKRANLSGLDTTIRGLLSEGIEDVDAVMFRLRDTPEFQKRFRANAARAANGLPELDFATYTGLEQSYRETMQAFGLPMGFYDDQTDFEKLIEGDVSVAELTTRIRDGFVKVRDADPEVKRQMQELYGVSDADLAAYFIDPKRARPLMMAQDYKRQAAAAQIAARGVEQGGMQLSKQEAEALAARGITGEEAQTQFAQQRQLAGLFEELAGEQALTREQKLGATFGYDVQAQQELERRARRRVAQFQTGGGFTRTTGATSGTIETGLGGPQ